MTTDENSAPLWQLLIINVLIGEAAFTAPSDFYLHNSDFDLDVPLVILSIFGRRRFQAEPSYFMLVQNITNQTNPAPGPGSRSHCESQCAHFQIQQATELKASPGE